MVDGVIGRDKLIARIWKKLETESIRFTAERRIGKTTVMQKMEREPKKGVEVIYLDLERVDSCNRFVETLVSRFQPLMSKKEKTHNQFNRLIESCKGMELAGVIKFPDSEGIDWQTRLEKVMECVCNNNDQMTLVLMFDELPYMIQKISVDSDQGPLQSLQLLDLLRELRNHHKSNLRMVYAGSIGLHHVLTALQDTKLPSQPVNEMPIVEIGELTLDDGIELAKNLIQIEEIIVSEGALEDVARTLSVETGCVPFYMIRVASRLSELERTISSSDISRIVLEHLSDDSDAWQMEHFRSRLKIYYSGVTLDARGNNMPTHIIASTVLDIIAIANQALSIDQIWRESRAQLSLSDKSQITELLRRLALDHYLVSDTKKRYTFRFTLIKQWWLIAQGLLAHD